MARTWFLAVAHLQRVEKVKEGPHRNLERLEEAHLQKDAVASLSPATKKRKQKEKRIISLSLSSAGSYRRIAFPFDGRRSAPKPLPAERRR